MRQIRRKADEVARLDSDIMHEDHPRWRAYLQRERARLLAEIAALEECNSRPPHEGECAITQ